MVPSKNEAKLVICSNTIALVQLKENTVERQAAELYLIFGVFILFIFFAS